MLTAHFHVRTVSSGFRVLKDGSNVNGGFKVATLIPNSSTGCLSIQFGLKRNSQFEIHGGRKTITVACKSSGGAPFDGGHFTDVDDQDHDFLPASLLLSETAIHHRMWRRGFKEETRRKLPGRWNPFGVMTRHSRTESSLVGHEFLRRFKNPTIFLNVSCNGEFLLPISVGEFAIERLLDTFWLENDGRQDFPDQFQLVRSLVQRLGYKVKMVKITERVVDTYFARLFLSKPGENENLSIDARPSDAISIANRCQAPIHISKEIIFKDAIRISYGTGRTRDKKPCYDVSLDSAADGPDLLSMELDLVRNMNLAVECERYSDAAMLRDKLMELRQDL